MNLKCITLDSIENSDGICGLWQEVFGDESEYIDFALNNMPNDTKVLTNEAGGQVVAISFHISIGIMPNEKTVYYTYAVCTHSDYRGKGLWKNQMKNIVDDFTRSNSDIIVYSKDELKDKYSEYGYNNIYKCIMLTLKKPAVCLGNKSITIAAFSDCGNITEITKKRNDVFKNTDYISYSDEYITCVINEKLYCGGIVDCISICNTSGEEIERAFLFGKKLKRILYVDEITLDIETLKDIYPQMLSYYEVDEVRIKYPSEYYDIIDLWDDVSVSEVYSGQGSIKSDKLYHPFILD